jgi:hypothetical protein
MKYKITKGSETYDRLWALWERIANADGAAYKLVQEIRKEMGLPHKGKDHPYAAAQSCLAGGICAIGFDVKPEG